MSRTRLRPFSGCLSFGGRLVATDPGRPRSSYMSDMRPSVRADEGGGRLLACRAKPAPAGKHPDHRDSAQPGRERVWQHAQTMEGDPIPAAQPETTPRRSVVRARLAARTAARVKVSLAS
jgi:hypothetical protein